MCPAIIITILFYDISNVIYTISFHEFLDISYVIYTISFHDILWKTIRNNWIKESKFNVQKLFQEM